MVKIGKAFHGEPQWAASKPSSDGLVVANQPEAKEPMKTGELIPLPNVGGIADTPHENGPRTAPALARHKPRRRVWRRRWRRAASIAAMLLSGLWRVFLIVLCAIGIAIAFSINLGFSAAGCAANGAVFMLVGNAILRTAGHSGYVPNREAAIVGAVGGIFALICIGIIFEYMVPKTEQTDQGPQHAWWLRLGATVAAGALTGPIGCSIMKRHVDLKGLDNLHAARAGALGGVIMGPGSIFLLPAILLAVGIILSPLWIAMALGFEFIYAKSNESWGPNSYSSSSCFCFGSCFGDEDIADEARRIPDVERPGIMGFGASGRYTGT